MRTSAAGSTPFPGVPILYAASGNPLAHDDDPAAGPAAENACALVDGQASQPNNVAHLAQIRPNAGDRPSRRPVELWALVRANGVKSLSALTWEITDPSGAHISTVSGTPVPPMECSSLGNAGVAGSMLDAAAATGQVAGALTTDIAARCARGELLVFRGVVQLSYQTACGAYRVDAAIGSAGVPKRTSFFDDQCFTAIQRDFDTVQWGNVAAGQEVRLRGDLTWSAASGPHPTLRNDGNAPASVAVVFGPLVPVDATGGMIPGATRIERFGACLGKADDTVRCITGIRATVRADFGLQPEVVLCPGEFARLDLSVLPGTDVSAGGYRGSFQIIESSAAVTCAAQPAR